MPPDNTRACAAVRTLLIGYGVAALGWLLTRTAPGAAPLDYAGAFSAPGLLLSGIALQTGLMIIRIVIRRQLPGTDLATHGLLILELVGDGITVLLFGLGTFTAILRATGSV